MLKRKILTAAFLGLISTSLTPHAWAETCVGHNPIGPSLGSQQNCTLDEDTAGALTIENTGVLTIDDQSLTIGHAIDGFSSPRGGSIVLTNGSSAIITQDATIGSSIAIDFINFSTSDVTWIANADITTDNSGDDIDMSAAGGNGRLEINNSATITGSITGGSSDTISVGDDNEGGTFNIIGDVNGPTLNVQSGDLTIDGNLDGSAVSVGNSNSLTVTETSGANTELSSLALGNDSSLTIDGILNTSALNLGENAVLNARVYKASAANYAINISGNYTSSGASLMTGIFIGGDAPINSTINVTGSADFSDDELTVFFESGTEILQNQVTDIILITGTDVHLNAPTLVANSYLYDFSLNLATDDEVRVDITRNDLDASTTTGLNLQTAETLLGTDLAKTEDVILEAIQLELINAPTREAFNEALESLQPSLDAAGFTVAGYVHDQARMSVQRRFSQLRHNDRIEDSAKLIHDRDYQDDQRNLNLLEPSSGRSAESGYVVPNKTRSLAQRRLQYLKDPSKSNERAFSQQYRLTQQRNAYNNKNSYKFDERPYQIWSEAYAGNGKQQRRNNIDGYKFNSSGMSFGADASSFDKKTILGAYVSYADTDINAGNANATDTHMESYQVGLYGNYLFDDGYFMNGLASLSLNDLSSNRFDVGGTSFVATAEYDAIYSSLGGEYGYYWETDDEMLVTSALGLYYSRMDFEPYRERGAGGANLVVDQSTLQRVDFGPSVTASYHRAFENGISFIPEAHLSYTYNLLPDKMQAVSYLQGTDTEDTDPSEVHYDGFDSQDHAFNLGLSGALASDTWKLLTNYNYQLKEDFDGHVASVKFNYNLN